MSQRTPSANVNEYHVELDWAAVDPFDGVDFRVEWWVRRIVFDCGRYCVRYHAESVEVYIMTKFVPVGIENVCDRDGREAVFTRLQCWV